MELARGELEQKVRDPSNTSAASIFWVMKNIRLVQRTDRVPLADGDMMHMAFELSGLPIGRPLGGFRIVNTFPTMSSPEGQPSSDSRRHETLRRVTCGRRSVQTGSSSSRVTDRHWDGREGPDHPRVSGRPPNRRGLPGRDRAEGLATGSRRDLRVAAEDKRVPDCSARAAGRVRQIRGHFVALPRRPRRIERSGTRGGRAMPCRPR